MIGTGWDNTEYRSYEFVDKTGEDPNASLAELPESRRRRHESEIPLTDAEQREMRAAYDTVFNEELKETIERIAAKNGTNHINGA
jgi:hypothetical protein